MDTVVLSDIAAITAYKRDLLTVDLLCWDLAIGPGTGTRVITFHEELPGFDAVATACAALPGFDTAWREAVVPNAFKPNVTVIYRRPA